MSIYLDIVSHDDVFQQLTYPPFLANDFDVTIKEEKDRLNNLLYTKYEGDSLSTLPQCECGFLRNTRFLNQRCPKCNHLVTTSAERPIQSGLWLRLPKGVLGFVNPHAWLILRQQLKVGPVNFLHWLTDPTYRPPGQSKELNKLMSSYPIERGLNFFIQNFDRCMDALFACRCIKGSKREKEEFMEYVKRNRWALFSQHIPIPSKIGFVTEDTPTGIYTDLNMTLALDAVRTISSVEFSIIPVSQRVAEAKTVRALNQLADYYHAFYKKSYNPKESWFRKQVYGTRSDFSMRAVITSISEPHSYLECHLPWSMSIMALKIHILSKLKNLTYPGTNRKYTHLEALRLYMAAIVKYDATIDAILQELIAESPYMGIPIILQRNPSLKIQSAQQLFVTRIKTDVEDNTIGFSVLCLVGPNADKQAITLQMLYLSTGDIADDRLLKRRICIDTGLSRVPDFTRRYIDRCYSKLLSIGKDIAKCRLPLVLSR